MILLGNYCMFENSLLDGVCINILQALRRYIYSLSKEEGSIVADATICLRYNFVFFIPNFDLKKNGGTFLFSTKFIQNMCPCSTHFDHVFYEGQIKGRMDLWTKNGPPLTFPPKARVWEITLSETLSYRSEGTTCVIILECCY